MEEKLMVDNESNSNDNDDHDKTTHSRKKVYIWYKYATQPTKTHFVC